MSSTSLETSWERARGGTTSGFTLRKLDPQQTLHSTKPRPTTSGLLQSRSRAGLHLVVAGMSIYGRVCKHLKMTHPFQSLSDKRAIMSHLKIRRQRPSALGEQRLGEKHSSGHRDYDNDQKPNAKKITKHLDMSIQIWGRYSCLVQEPYWDSRLCSDAHWAKRIVGVVCRTLHCAVYPEHYITLSSPIQFFFNLFICVMQGSWVKPKWLLIIFQRVLTKLQVMGTTLASGVFRHKPFSTRACRCSRGHGPDLKKERSVTLR